MLRQYGKSRGEHRVLITALADSCGLHRDTLYEARKGRLSEKTQIVLSKIIREIESGRIRYHRVGQEWQFSEAPQPLPPPQDKFLPAKDRNLWALCRCGNWRFSPFILHGKLYLGCTACFGEGHWRGIGGVPVKLRSRAKSARHPPVAAAPSDNQHGP
jgi:hypothetical protein